MLILVIPHLMVYCCCKERRIIKIDVQRWASVINLSDKLGGGNFSLLKLAYLLLFLKEYRNLFYLRVGRWRWLLYYLRPLSSLYICVKSENFGAGTFIQHGFSTIITAKRIGKNCWINQQVTIGYNNSRTLGIGQPTIGDNVRISAGTKVIGPITVGDNSIIGANAVVAKNLPRNSVAIPSPTVIKEMKI